MFKEVSENKMARVENAETAYNEEKCLIRTTKAITSKNITRHEVSLEEFNALEEFDLPDGGLLKIAKEIEENVATVKTTYMKMETLNEPLVKKLILMDKVTKVPDMEKWSFRSL